MLWNGKSGACLNDLPDLLQNMHGPPPSIIIVHLGTNDLGKVFFFSMRQRVVIFMQFCKSMYPNALLLWSEILPRAFYFGANPQEGMERQRRAVNRWARSRCGRMGAVNLSHKQFLWTNFSLFRRDGVHLSPEGNTIFRNNLLTAIWQFSP